jgi:hypothetical protein
MFEHFVVEMDGGQQPKLIKFITGCDRLPRNRRNQELDAGTHNRADSGAHGQNPDEPMPSVITCTTSFKIPRYSTKQVMREKLLKAISECQ